MTAEQRLRSKNDARFAGAFAFLDGKRFNRNNIITDGTAIYSYGTHFAMGSKRDDGSIITTNRKYSVTTSKHQSGLYAVLYAAGYAPVDDDLNGHTVWERS